MSRSMHSRETALYTVSMSMGDFEGAGVGTRNRDVAQVAEFNPFQTPGSHAQVLRGGPVASAATPSSAQAPPSTQLHLGATLPERHDGAPTQPAVAALPAFSGQTQPVAAALPFNAAAIFGLPAVPQAAADSLAESSQAQAPGSFSGLPIGTVIGTQVSTVNTTAPAYTGADIG